MDSSEAKNFMQQFEDGLKEVETFIPELRKKDLVVLLQAIASRLVINKQILRCLDERPSLSIDLPPMVGDADFAMRNRLIDEMTILAKAQEVATKQLLGK
jgi:hypothetical protein